MKRTALCYVCLISMITAMTAFAANVTKVVITTVEPAVGEKPTYKASVPETASTEVYEVLWNGEFDKGVFVLGRNYTMTVKLRIKASSSNRFSTSSNINVTINGHKARVTEIHYDNIVVKYTWKSVGGEDPNDPKNILKARLDELAAAYPATNASNDKEILRYLRDKLPTAEIWPTGGSYTYTRKMPSETADGHVCFPLGITYNGTTLKNYAFIAVLPALNKSPEALMLREDMEILKATFRNLIVTSKTEGDEVLEVLNSVMVNGSKAVWDENYKYDAPTSNLCGSIDGNIILALGNSKEVFRAHITLPIAGTAADAAIDADFSVLSKALHNHVVTNKTTQDELMRIANSAMRKGSKITCTGFTKTDATIENEGKIVMYFELENKNKTRSPRIAMKIDRLKAILPPELAVTQYEWELSRLTNIERFKKRLPLLAVASPLQDAAQAYAKGTSSNAIEPSFIAHRTVYQNNLPMQKLPSQAIKKLMELPANRANILREDLCYIGSGMSMNSVSNLWVQIFVGSCTVIDVESSTGSFNFYTISEMENAYLICNMGYYTKAYIPLDVDYMHKEGNKFILKLKGKTVTINVRDVESDD